MLAALLLAILSSSTAASALALPVSVSEDAALTDSTVGELRAETERLLRLANLQIEWRPEASLAYASLWITPRPESRRVVGCRRGLHDHRLGHASLGSNEVTLFVDHVARAATGDWDSPTTPRISERDLGRALARALVHELGHLLLNERSHRRRGIMRPTISQRDLVAEKSKSMMFSPSEVSELRERLASPAAADAGAK